MSFVARYCTVCSFTLVSIFSHSHKNCRLAMLPPPTHIHFHTVPPRTMIQFKECKRKRESTNLNTRFHPVTPNKVYYNGNRIRMQSRFVTADFSMPVTHLRKVRKRPNMYLDKSLYGKTAYIAELKRYHNVL